MWQKVHNSFKCKTNAFYKKERENYRCTLVMKRSFWNSAPEFGNVVGAVDCENSTRTLRSACGSRRFHFFREFHKICSHFGREATPRMPIINIRCPRVWARSRLKQFLRSSTLTRSSNCSISISPIIEILKHNSMKDGKLSKEEFKNLMENRK